MNGQIMISLQVLIITMYTKQMEVSLIIQMMSGGTIRTAISLMTLKRTGISTLRMEITGE